MALKFVRSPDEGVIRSVGDPPNGVVGFVGTAGDVFGVAISARFDPTKDGNQVTFGDDDGFETEHVDATAAVDALDDVDTAYSLLNMAKMATATACALSINESTPRKAIPALEALEELLAAMQDRYL